MRQVWHSIVRFVSCFIPVKRLRRRVRAWLWDFRFSDVYHWMKFKFHRVGNNTVLIIEANDCHGEVMPGIIKYVHDLGYDIECVVNSRVTVERPFARMNDIKFRVYTGFFSMFAAFFTARNLARYKHVIIMSSTIYRYGGILGKSVLDVWPNLRGVRSLFIMEHDMRDIARHNNERLADDGRILALGRFDGAVFVNSHYFGDVKITPKNKITNFVAVGGIEPERKNHAMLIDAVRFLHDAGAQFIVTIVGKGDLSAIPAELHQHIRICGRLKFPKMYDEMESADFFLPLLDAASPLHDRYITNGVTGSAQLIYGFLKIPVIHTKFASFYGFDKTNSITYDDNLGRAMLDAINMTADEYAKMQSELRRLAVDVAAQSANNMAKCLVK